MINPSAPKPATSARSPLDDANVKQSLDKVRLTSQEGPTDPQATRRALAAGAAMMRDQPEPLYALPKGHAADPLKSPSKKSQGPKAALQSVASRWTKKFTP